MKNLNDIRPTAEEEHQLRIVIEDWDTRSTIQKALCIAMIRGNAKLENASAYLGLSPEEIMIEVPGLWGVLFDRNEKRFRFK